VQNKVTHSVLIREARREIRALKRPAGVRSDSWRSVIELLSVIAGYLPEPYPSQRVLSKKLEIRQQTISDQVRRAVAWGLLAVSDRPNPGGLMDGTNYHLLCLSEGLKADLTRHGYQTRFPVQSKNSYSVGVQDAPPFREGLPSGLRPLDRKDNVVAFNRNRDEDWDTPAIGEDPNGPLPSAGPVKVDPAVYLARQFDSKWAEAKRTTPALRVIRASSRGMAIGYLRKVMLPEISPQHVEAYMDAFVDACVAGDVLVKESQFAFERFTGWWGREDVEDPSERLAASELSRLMREQARAIREQRLTNG